MEPALGSVGFDFRRTEAINDAISNMKPAFPAIVMLATNDAQ